MENLPIPDVGETIVRLAGLSPAAQVAAVVGIACIAIAWIWTRRPQPVSNVDAATVVEALRLTAQAQAEMTASMATIAHSIETVGDEVRQLTGLVLTHLKQTA
ncbi:hypothetical protein SAMN02982917_5504 [Azospirillum oryzae]|uniref:Uncharacterized protein n=1 Tax=Azospirillum oryzae TaxID=286727 RepID=A0A1X7HBD7_9PROT|nr:hypothetical protein [Azospirillum oryzae]SMF83280.1 hypothetical protein SAMN02982917_5504 [Azospirillum oryzae]